MFAKKTEAEDRQALETLARRVEALEARCAALSEALADRDARLEAVGLEQRVLARRLDLAVEQSGKAVEGLLRRLQPPGPAGT